MTFDLVLRNARLSMGKNNSGLVDVAIQGEKIVAMQSGLPFNGNSIDLAGRLLSPGLIETHIHLDKSRILDRCTPSPNRGRDHMARVSAVKPGFTVEDVYQRARTTLEKCVMHGATHMRTHVEVDPNVGLRGFDALRQLGRDSRWAIDLELCVFAQEGWTGVPEVDANLVQCLKQGASVIGGAPGYDSDSAGQIRRIFELAREFDVDVDIHLDVGPTAKDMDIHLVCELTEQYGWGGRVAVGHGTKYASLPPAEMKQLARRMADTGIALTVLPATDLFVMGRHLDHDIIRGVTDAKTFIGQGANCCLSTNNVLNPFTPFGDGSLVRIANLYANTVQWGSEEELSQCFEMMTTRPARLLGLQDYGIAVGNPADLVVWDAHSPSEALATIAPALHGFKRGRPTFTRTLAQLHRP